MNRLRNCRGYLCGPMDLVADGGVVWRRRIQVDLRHLGIHWLDPCNKPCKVGTENDETRALRHLKKEQGDWQFLANEMSPIRRVDIRMVDFSDFLIVFLDRANSGFGTIAELTRANEQMKPIIVMQEGGKKYTPDWLWGMLPERMIFGDWTSLYYYLESINGDSFIESEDRWLWFDWQGTQKPAKSYNTRGTQSSRHPEVTYDADKNTFGNGAWPENLK